MTQASTSRSLSEFRARLLAASAECRLLDLMLFRFQEREWLEARGRLRTNPRSLQPVH